MSPQIRWRLGQSLALSALGAAALAPAAHAAPSGGASQISTPNPDVVSARILQGRDATQVSRAEVCYDAAVNQTADERLGNALGTFTAEGEDVNDVAQSTRSRVIVSNPKCVQVDFGALPIPGDTSPGVDLAAYTVVVDDGAGARTLAGEDSTLGSAALDGTRRAPRLGATAGPDLISTPVVDATNGTITFEFDEPIAHAGAANPLACALPTLAGIGYYTASSTLPGGLGLILPVLPTSMVNDAGTKLTVTGFGLPFLLGAAPKRFYLPEGAVRSLQCNPNVSSTAGTTTLAPELLSATKSGPNEWTLKYDDKISASLATIANIVAYTEDGQTPYPATSFAPTASQDTLKVTFAGVQNLDDKVVGLADKGGGALDVTNTFPTTPGTLGVRAANAGRGYTDGPDLTQVALNSTNNTAVFRFDQKLLTGVLPPLGGFNLIGADGSMLTPSAVNSVAANGTDVIVQFTAGQIAGARGGTVADSTVFDNELKGNSLGTAGTGAAAPLPPVPPLPPIAGPLLPLDDPGPLPPLGPNGQLLNQVGAPAPATAGSGGGSSSGSGSASASGASASSSSASPAPSKSTSGSSTVTSGSTGSVPQPADSGPRGPFTLDGLSRRVKRTGRGRYTVTGVLDMPAVLDPVHQLACAVADHVFVRVLGGGQLLENQRAAVGGNCAYKARFKLSRSETAGLRRLKFSVLFAGTPSINAKRAANAFARVR